MRFARYPRKRELTPQNDRGRPEGQATGNGDGQLIVWFPPFDTGVGGGLPSLLRYLNVWIGWTRRAGLPGSCPIAQAIVELSFLPGPLREAAAAAESVWRQTLIMLIRDAIDKRHLLQDTDVAQLAWDFLGIYLSHHVSSHSLRDPDADRKAQFSVKRIVASIEATNEGATHQRQAGQ